MAEDGKPGAIGLVLLAVAFAVIAAGAAWRGHLSAEKMDEEIFAAAAAAALDVCVVGIVVQWYERRARVRERRLAMLEELSAIREKVRQAQLLLTAHRSAKTWTEQMRELIGLIPRLANLEEAGGPASLARAREDLGRLKDEYVQKHETIDGLNKQWDAIQQAAPLSMALVVSDTSPLIDTLNESVHAVRRQLE